jgi:M6 family metalloprotease-like protein
MRVGRAMLIPPLLMILTGSILSSADSVYAGPAVDIEESLPQPDGQVIWAKRFGDEHVNGFKTLDGYLILQNPSTGYWVYAAPGSSGESVPSDRVVGRDEPVGIPKGLRQTQLQGAASPSARLFSAASASSPAAPNLGGQPILVLFVDFTPSVRVGSTPANWNSRFFGATGSVKKYYEETSYGAFTLTPAVETDAALGGSVNDGIVSVTLPNAHPNTANSRDDRNRQIVHDALLAAAPYVNFAAFDTDGDAVISSQELHIIVVVAGYEASFSTSCGSSVWAHQWGLYGAVPAVTLNGVEVGGSYTQVGEWHCSSSSPPGHQATIGPLVHELGHDLGLPDLYDTDGSSEGIGKWGTMGGGSWNRVSLMGDSPANMDPWSKYFEGWVTPSVVTGTMTNETISPAATTADVYQLLPGTPDSGEYFLVENRQKLGFDAGLPGVGLMIWHVDTQKVDNTEECYPGGPPCALSHYKVAVVQADGLYDLEKNANSGDVKDPWPGSLNKIILDDISVPNSRLYDGTVTGWSVTNISGAGETITATMTQSGAALTVSKNGNGSGTVTSSPVRIDCGATCTAAFPYNTPVTLTAAPAAGSFFIGWGGACAPMGASTTCTLTMDAAKGVSATFSLAIPLTVSKAGSGTGAVTSSPSGLDCGTTCVANFPYNSSVTLTATPGTGSRFAAWGGACSSMGANLTCTVTMDAAKSVTANFTLLTFSLTVHQTGTGSGAVTPVAAGTSGTYDYGTLVSLAATAASGSLFTGWSGDCSGTGPCALTLTQARTVTASFVQVPSFTTLAYQVLYAFTGGDEAKPDGGLIQASDGNFYGTTSGGTSGNGTIFRLTPSGTRTTLHTFIGTDGAHPHAGLIQGSDGNIYGTTYDGGSGYGTVFRITLSGTLTTLHTFTGSAGAYPLAPLMPASDGNLYGTAYSGGGGAGYGTVFRVAPNGTVSLFYAFAGGSAGAHPRTPLVQGSDGNFYGTTASDASAATIFRLTPSGAFTTLYTFSGTQCQWASSPCYLTAGSDGMLYGTTYQGGASGYGTTFQLTLAGTFTTLHSFTVSDGAYPHAPLVQGSDGNFYGTAYSGGPSGSGTVFRITPAGGFTVIHAFAGGSAGTYPMAPVLQASDGNFYGATSEGGSPGAGVAFVLRHASPISVSKIGTGTGTVTSNMGGINCGNTCSANFTIGTIVTLTAASSAGSTFTGWSGACTGTGSCTVTMTSARNVTATFTSLANNLALSIGGSSSGTVISSPGGINCGATCAASFASGATVTLTAGAGAGGTFREWRGDSCSGSISSTCSITMKADKSVTAVFSKTFTDSILTGGVTPIKAVHIVDLRTAIETLRNRLSLGAFAWMDTTLTPGSAPVKRQHLLDLRTALNQAYAAAGRTAPTYAESITAGATPIRAAHLAELRSFIRDLE